MSMKNRFEFNEETEEVTSDNAIMRALIDEYVNLQRIKTATDQERELDYQISVAKAKLRVYGVSPEKLEYPA